MRKRTLLLLFIIVVVAAGAYYGWNEYHRGHQDTAGIKPVAARKAAELVKEFEENEMAANLQYNDKVVSVAGKIVKIDINDSTKNVLLAGESAMAGVLCQFTSAEYDHLQNLKNGDMIKVKGVCTGVLMDVILTRCVIEK